MPESMKIIRGDVSAAERDVQYMDQGFVPAKSSAAATSAAARSPSPVRHRLAIYSPTDSNTSDWIMRSFQIIEARSVPVDHELPDMFLRDLDARFLAAIWKNLDELTEPARSSPSARLCRRFAEGAGMALASVPRVRCAVFGDKEDGVELVAHSRATLRQVSFEFKPDGNTINIVSIDEEMRRFERACGIEKVLTLSKAVKWLNPC
jgi:hypothetical protein